MTKDRPIIFNAEMVRAILEGRKTQTRRPIKPQPEKNNCWYKGKSQYEYTAAELVISPYAKHKVGDRLWVRETWMRATPANMILSVPKYMRKAIYRTDKGSDKWGEYYKWCPSIHMPRWASRITLEVTNVRVEEVQEISPSDCECEGIAGKSLSSPVRGQPYEEYRNGDGLVYSYPNEAFKALWNSIYSKTFSWADNPWVWVIEFKKVEGDKV